MANFFDSFGKRQDEKRLQRARERANFEMFDKAEREFTSQFYGNASREDWTESKKRFPICPLCKSNKDVKVVIYGLRRTPPEEWEREFVSFRGCMVASAHRWTCTACGEEFFGHQSPVL
jgi:hypothetical protein